VQWSQPKVGSRHTLKVHVSTPGGWLDSGVNMVIDKKERLEKICYTDLVYDRIRKKLSVQMVNEDNGCF